VPSIQMVPSKWIGGHSLQTSGPRLSPRFVRVFLCPKTYTTQRGDAVQPNVENCLYSELVEPHKLIPNPRNPNKHPDEQIRLLAKVIDFTGWRHAIVVSKRSGFIVEGHARLQAAQLWGYDVVPVHYQDWENEAREWADMLADNRLAELAEIDRTVLKDLIEELDTGAVDMEMTGFTDQAIEDLMTEFHVQEEGINR